MHIESYDPLLKLRFLYEKKHHIDHREDQNYKENKEATKPTGVHIRKLEQSYMKKKRKVEENHLAQQLHSY